MPKGVYKRTEETRKRMSDSKKGKMPKNINLILGKRKGTKHTPEAIRKIKEARAKQVITDEHKRHMGESHKGNKSHFWRGGVCSEDVKMKLGIEYRLWRKAVLERDKFTCRFCGVRGGKLHADHIKPFALFPELRLAIDNGRTLCISCHRKTDTFGWNTAKKLKNNN